MAEPSSLEKLHWVLAEQRRGPEAWRAAWLDAIDRAFRCESPHLDRFRSANGEDAMTDLKGIQIMKREFTGRDSTRQQDAH